MHKRSRSSRFHAVFTVTFFFFIAFIFVATIVIGGFTFWKAKVLNSSAVILICKFNKHFGDTFDVIDCVLVVCNDLSIGDVICHVDGTVFGISGQLRKTQ